MTIVRRLLRPLRQRTFPGSASYWEDRYARGGTSGPGSYGPTAAFKAATLNAFVEQHGVGTVLELGCGDGHQLSLADYPSYVGFDVAPAALELCRRRFAADPTKRFELYDAATIDTTAPKAELTLSLDVLFHLVEDDVYETYMRQLFDAATRFVAIFAVDRDEWQATHVRYRRFTDWVSANRPDWSLLDRIDFDGKGAESESDMYFYERRPGPVGS